MASRREELEQIFETCLEQIQSGHETIESALARYPEAAEALRSRLEAALWLDERKGSLDPRPGFVSASRGRLVSQIKRDMATQSAMTKAPKESWFVHFWHQLVPQGPGAGRRFAFQLALILVFLFTTLSGGRQIVLAAQYAIPGDTLNPVRIALERVEMVTTLDLAEEIRLHVEFAHTRLEEVQALVLEGRYTYVPQTLARFGAHVNQAVSKLETLARRDAGKAVAMASLMHESFSEQAVLLDILMDTVPLAIQPDFTRALKVTAGAIIVIDDVNLQAGGTSAPTPTSVPATDDVNTSSSPQTEPPAAIISPTPMPTATLEPTLPPSPTSTLTATPTATYMLLPTSTPTSGSTGGPIDPTSTQPPPPEPTSTQPAPPEPTDEPKPTKTDKPRPTRNPNTPKPKKTSTSD